MLALLFLHRKIENINRNLVDQCSVVTAALRISPGRRIGVMNTRCRAHMSGVLWEQSSLFRRGMRLRYIKIYDDEV